MTLFASDELELEHLLLELPSREELHALREAGLPRQMELDMRFLVKVAMIRYQPEARFNFDGNGVRAFVLPVRDAYEAVIDLAAWRIDRPDKVARLEGRASCLGEGLLEAPETYFGGRPLSVYRDAMGWLRAAGQGVVIIDRANAWRRFLEVPSIAGEDTQHGLELQTLLTPPVPSCRVLVPASYGRLAA
ncbi:hypothetical protein [Terrihabitans rhizophilus]|uniref:Uncharacterized protein n=1 Tax=Terrihabitans rhizophilus TaxID=3092662 RepID=A0ABU4RQQ1_9HYPH|nr:hypothetical protein [Terrihabitans sp. PJ23]MDX6807171.1 hypothetical protein [Terrihabitans sp. PJ23]